MLDNSDSLNTHKYMLDLTHLVHIIGATSKHKVFHRRETIKRSTSFHFSSILNHTLNRNNGNSTFN